MKTLTSEQRAALEKMAKVLAQKLSANPLLAELDGPANLTIKKRNGEYRKLSFQGETKFSFNGAYLGKSGNVILCAVPTTPVVDVRGIEIEMDGAKLFGLSFVRAINDRLSGAFEKEQELIKQAADAALNADLERLNDPAYASW